MNEETLQTIKKFESMPETPEKKRISDSYLNDEIGQFEFYSAAISYIRDNSD